MKQKRKKSTSATIAGILLFIGLGIVITIPYLLKRPEVINYFNYLNTTGPIGDTIGGLTAPFLNLIGACLVFFALRSQVHANNLLQQQIEDQKEEKRLTDDAQNLNQLYLYLEKNIESFKFTSLPTYFLANHGSITVDVQYAGGEAFEHFFQQIRCHYHGPQDALDNHQSVAEVISILTLMDLLIMKLPRCKCSNKEMLLTLIKHQFLYKMTTSIKKIDIEELQVYHCENCKCNHGLPEHIRSLIKNIQNNLKDI